MSLHGKGEKRSINTYQSFSPELTKIEYKQSKQQNNYKQNNTVTTKR